MNPVHTRPRTRHREKGLSRELMHGGTIWSRTSELPFIDLRTKLWLGHALGGAVKTYKKRMGNRPRYHNQQTR